MKITVTLAIEVDQEAWGLTYGTSGTQAIRDDVKSYVVETLQGSAAVDEKCITAVIAR